ncbi:MAG: HPr(Ser) kinase/phosphatase, partial [Clostridiales bacterium]|nr:HPr(Ser) kinase/phosphatase [Clostridiales bacterium]
MNEKLSSEKIAERVKVAEFAQKLKLEVLYEGKSEEIVFSNVNVNRPGLFLSGYSGLFPFDRIQIIGESETSYITQMAPDKRLKIFEKFFAYELPCLIISTNIRPFPETMDAARKFGRPVFRSEKRTSRIFNDIVLYLNDLLAPTESRHGVLIDIYGVGVLLTGHSGVGKSETALELVQRGHRLVADDAVIIKYVNDLLVGTSPPIIRYFMEVRGIGIIDVRSMYGVGAVKLTKVLDLVVEMEPWDDS